MPDTPLSITPTALESLQAELLNSLTELRDNAAGLQWARLRCFSCSSACKVEDCVYCRIATREFYCAQCTLTLSGDGTARVPAASNPLNMNIEMPTIETIRKLVLANVGVAFLPRMCVESELRQGLLCAIEVKEITVERKIHLVRHSQRALSYAASAFLEVLNLA